MTKPEVKSHAKQVLSWSLQPPFGAAPLSNPRPPARLGVYRIVAELGSGGTGYVYRAEHMLLARSVAIKLLRPELSNDPAYFDLFLAEARAANRIRSDAVVNVIDIGRADGGLAYLVMELVEGRELRDILRRGELSVYHAVSIARQVCEVLEAVHAGGVVHRDIKPENIHIVERDGEGYVKLLDFGIAAYLDGAEGKTEVTKGVLIGTPEYMAPEQAGGGEMDHRCDLYSVGALLFEMLTRRPPFKSRNLEQIVHDISFKPPPLPSQLRELPESVREQLDRIVSVCLAKCPDDRPQSAAELVDALYPLEEKLAMGGSAPRLGEILCSSDGVGRLSSGRTTTTPRPSRKETVPKAEATLRSSTWAAGKE